MKQLEQRVMWSHGTPFIVRRVPASGGISARHVSHYSKVYYTFGPATAPPGYVIFAPCGKYLARVRPDQLKRWLNYFAKQALTH